MWAGQWGQREQASEAKLHVHCSYGVLYAARMSMHNAYVGEPCRLPNWHTCGSWRHCLKGGGCHLGQSRHRWGSQWWKGGLNCLGNLVPDNPQDVLHSDSLQCPRRIWVPLRHQAGLRWGRHRWIHDRQNRKHTTDSAKSASFSHAADRMYICLDAHVPYNPWVE